MRVRDLFSEETGVMGPGTDLVISLVAVLVMVLAINSEKLKAALEKIKHQEELIAEVERLRDIESKYLEEQEILDKIQKNQMILINRVERLFSTNADSIAPDHFGFIIDGNPEYDIQIINDLAEQRISFGSNVLFDPDKVILKARGQQLLQQFGSAIKSQIRTIREVQIQGHADTVRSRLYETNLELAAQRALAVFSYFSKNNIVDPINHLMSATSYGQYKPVQRKDDESGFNRTRLRQANDTERERRINRRIEIILIYRK